MVGRLVEEVITRHGLIRLGPARLPGWARVNSQYDIGKYKMIGLFAEISGVPEIKFVIYLHNSWLTS